MDFKQRVRNSIVDGAAIYKAVFLDYEYLIYSPEFSNRPYYIVSANADNYAHLTGVHSLLSAQDFFIACYNGTIRDSDFDFKKGRKSEASIIGTVRKKIASLPFLSSLFVSKLHAEENFSKGHIHCLIAATDTKITLGFVNAKFAIPQTLLKGNQVDNTKAVDITLVLRRDKGSEEFDTVIQGDPGDMLSLLNKLMNQKKDG